MFKLYYEQRKKNYKIWPLKVYSNLNPLYTKGGGIYFAQKQANLKKCW